ncbi:VOC family protein [Microbacterium indicum]|uniref:VOC family protein n=1 Tax=Microbacterium indicum TaxID=358100 RepID=UPI0004059063|nr:VOC family protein [Microbacterium indicum]
MGFKLAPYLSFSGQAEDALEFYRDVFGGTLQITRYREMPMEDLAGDPEWVMHGQLTLENGVTIMASDAPGVASGSQISMMIYGDDRDELAGFFEAMHNGGSVTTPFEPSPWGSWYGAVVDAFGIAWGFEGGQPAAESA